MKIKERVYFQKNVFLITNYNITKYDPMRKNYQILISVFGGILYSATAMSAIPAGYYYSAEGKQKADLKTALHQIISQAHMLSYGSGEGRTWQGFFATDQLSDGMVLDRYSSEKRFFDGFNGVEGMHIEHSFPKSWWGSYENNAYRDLFHLYPADGTTNTTKGNQPLGEVLLPASFDNGISKIGKNGFGSPYSGTCFEPADVYKGDFARSYLYMVTAYEDFASLWNSPMLEKNTYPVWSKWALDLLLKWHRQDPVSELEKERQEKVFSIQGNRNPYIDYPELVEYVWGKDTLSVFPFPAETEPFLVSPSRWDRLNMGVLMQNDSKTETLEIVGKNIQSDIQLALKQTDSPFRLSKTVVSAAEALQGQQIKVDFTAITPGYVYDTLVISSSDLAAVIEIPLSALVATEFMLTGATEQTSTSVVLNWINVPNIKYYLLDIYQGNLAAGDLLISKYIEGSAQNKAIEIYNGTGRSIDLSHYSLRKQNNGVGAFGSETVLSGILENNKTYLIVNAEADILLQEKADLLLTWDNGPMGFNGNDALALYRNGVLIDQIGERDQPAMWGENCTLIRTAQTTHPSATFSWKEWSKKPIDFFEGIGEHQMMFDPVRNYLVQNENVGINTSYFYDKLKPEQCYTYQVTAVFADESKQTSINTMQFVASELAIPEILQASEITSSGFLANWEVVPEATHYLLDVFTLIGNEIQREEENFNTVANGKPLPSGWSGTASGSYTTATSSGKAPNSIGLKGNEWLQTKEYPAVLTDLSFMYRYTSSTSAVGSYFVIDGFVAGNWVNIDTIRYKNTSKAFPSYSFNQPFTALRFNYANKAGSANLALDDIAVTYGKQDTVFLHKSLPVNGDAYRVTNLQEETYYYYQLRSALNDVASKASDVAEVKTLLGLSSLDPTSSEIRYSTLEAGIYLSGLSGDTSILLFQPNGVLAYITKSSSSDCFIPCERSGIFILRIISERGCQTIRIRK